MSYGLDGRVSILGRGKRFFFTPERPDLLWNPSSLSIGYRGCSPGGKRQGREADHPSPSSAEVKNDGAIPPLHHTSSWRGA
jgi:hypothetical protein